MLVALLLLLLLRDRLFLIRYKPIIQNRQELVDWFTSNNCSITFLPDLAVG